MKSDNCAPPKNIGEHQKASDQACNYFKRADLTLSDADAVSKRTMTAPNGKTVTIRRDGWGVPYIDAEDREAAGYGLGFAAGQARLWRFAGLEEGGGGKEGCGGR